MLGLYVCLADERTTRFEVKKTHVKIGSGGENDLVLSEGGVLLSHCELEHKDDGWYLLPRGRVTVRKRRIETVTRVEDGDDIGIGDYTIVLELVPRGADGPSDATEHELFEAVAMTGDDESRMVYADWLEGNGDKFRAEFLRLSQQLAGIMPTDRRAWFESERQRRRLRELANHIDMVWRQRVSRPPVEGCRRPSHERCTMDWGRLEDRDDPRKTEHLVRHCTRCGQRVFYCDTILQAQKHVREGQRVVIDVRVGETVTPSYIVVDDDNVHDDDERWDEPTQPR
jgi:uncharacterized protein (TIGR02996 family)